MQINEVWGAYIQGGLLTEFYGISPHCQGGLLELGRKHSVNIVFHHKGDEIINILQNAGINVFSFIYSIRYFLISQFWSCHPKLQPISLLHVDRGISNMILPVSGN